jgi:hypothetical protein
LERQAQATKPYWPFVAEAASESHVDPKIIIALLTVENWNRSPLRRTLKVRAAEISSVVARFSGTNPANVTVGPGQLKLSTALWIRANFRQIPGAKQSLGKSINISTIEELADPKENIRYMAKYLAHLCVRRYHQNCDLHSDPERLKVIATEYHRGMRSLQIEHVDRYGEIVAALAYSQPFEDLLWAIGK